MANKVFIATSLDGYIADTDGKIDWLHETPNPDNIDCGFADFMQSVNAIIMGRSTFQTVDGFDCEWPYKKPVYVLSSTLTSLPSKYQGKAEIINGAPSEVVAQLHQKGFKDLYIDGGKTVQSFMQENLIDELIVTTMPILLGGGTHLFGAMDAPTRFNLIKTQTYLENLVQNHYKVVSNP